jgi:hypothetical protein
MPETKRPGQKGGNPRGPNGKCQLRCALEESAAQSARRYGGFGAMHANRNTEEANVKATFCYRIVTALLQHDAAGDSKQPPAPDLVNRKVVADPRNRLQAADVIYLATSAGVDVPRELD